MMLDLKADPNIVDQHGQAPLHIALQHRNFPIIDALLDKGANPNVAGNGMKTTPLHIACSLGMEREADLLLKKGANPNAKDAAGRTPLHNAMHNSFAAQDLAKLLLKSGADPVAEDMQGTTPYDLATYLGKNAVAEMFRKALQNKGKSYKPKRPNNPPWYGGGIY
jgi:ankyrin repeat protein